MKVGQRHCAHPLPVPFALSPMLLACRVRRYDASLVPVGICNILNSTKDITSQSEAFCEEKFALILTYLGVSLHYLNTNAILSVAHYRYRKIFINFIESLRANRTRKLIAVQCTLSQTQKQSRRHRQRWAAQRSRR